MEVLHSIMSDFFQFCSTSKEIKSFFLKHYGFELLIRLYDFGVADADNGIDDTLASIKLNTPRREAFSTFIDFLVTNGAVLERTSTTKKSKKVLRLSASTQDQMDEMMALLKTLG